MSHGGDVVRIAGDAIISVFEDESTSIKRSIAKAQSACLDILRHYNNYEIDGNQLQVRRAKRTPFPGRFGSWHLCSHLHTTHLSPLCSHMSPPPQVRLYMSVGSLSIFNVGGYHGRWEYMISGQPFGDLKLMADLGSPGELTMSSPCWDIQYSGTSRKLSTEYEFVDLRNAGESIGIKQTSTVPAPGSNETAQRCVLIKMGENQPATQAGGNVGDQRGESIMFASDDADGELLLTKRTYAKSSRQRLLAVAKGNRALEGRLKHFVPSPVTFHCDHQNVDLDWLEEAAQCSAMFVTFKETIGDLEGVQKVFVCLQRIIMDNHGIIKEFSMDDKGLVIVVGFGLQPNVVSNPAACACLAALQIRHSQSIGNAAICIGIATGQVFCAAIGSDFRREYAIVGKVVNIAARLAYFARKLRSSKAGANADPSMDICVDTVTMSLAKSRIDFITNKNAKNISLKGIKGTTSVYNPTEPRFIQLLEMANLVNSHLVGRKDESALIEGLLEELYDDLGGGLLIIKGQAGMGKSHLVHQLVKANKRMKSLLVFHGQGVREKINQNVRATLTPLDFQCAQAEGLDSWDNVLIKLVTMFRDGCLEPLNGQAHKKDVYEQIKYAFTAYVPGNLATLNSDNDTVEARSIFVEIMVARFLPDHKDTAFLLNYILATNLPVVKEVNDKDDEAVFKLVAAFTVASLKLLTRFSPVCIVIDDAQYCERESLDLVKAILAEMASDVMIVCCARTGSRSLPDMRLHVPTMTQAPAVSMRNTIKAVSAFGRAGKGKLGGGGLKSMLVGKKKGGLSASIVEGDAGEEEGEQKEDPPVPLQPKAPTGDDGAKKSAPQSARKVVSPSKPVPPKLGSTKAIAGKFQYAAPKFNSASPRKSVLEKRIKTREAAAHDSKTHVMGAGEIRVVTKTEKDLHDSILDTLADDLISTSPELKVTKILLKPLNFNETIALTAAVMGTEKLCNITAAGMYGHTQGNPKYVKEYAGFLKEGDMNNGGEEFGSPVQMFDENLDLQKEQIWTLKTPRLPEMYFSTVPPDIMDEIRVALRQCSAQQMWILKVMAVVGGSDCPIFLLEELLEDAVLSVSELEEDMCELVSMGIIETTVVKAIIKIGISGMKKVNAVDALMAKMNPNDGGNAGSSDAHHDDEDTDNKTCYLTYTFINTHCQTACYNMLSFSRRQELHEQIANWYEHKLGVGDAKSDAEDSSEEEEEEEMEEVEKAGTVKGGLAKDYQRLMSGGAGKVAAKRDRRGRSTQLKNALKVDKNFKMISKKYSCFLIHHHFMSSSVDKAVAICNLIGSMELQTYCGQYARKVLTQLPNGLNDAILHRIYPCIRWMQGVSSVINALKKGKVGFGAVTAGKMISNKLQGLRKKTCDLKKGIAEIQEASIVNKAKRDVTIAKIMTNKIVGALGGRVSPEGKGVGQRKSSGASPVVARGSLCPVIVGKNGGGGSAKKVAQVGGRKTSSAKLEKYAAAYGGNTAAGTAVKKEKDENVLSLAANFSGVSWAEALKKTTKKLRNTLHTKMAVVNMFSKDGFKRPQMSTEDSDNSGDESADGLCISNLKSDSFVKFGIAYMGEMGESTDGKGAGGGSAKFWKPDFDAAKAVADAEKSSDGGSEALSGAEAENDVSPMLENYIMRLKEQQSKRAIGRSSCYAKGKGIK